MSNQNVFRIDSKLKLTKTINKKKDILIILIYIRPSIDNNIYGPIIDLAKKYPKYYYMFIDVDNFDDLSNDYYLVQYTPMYVVYYNCIPISQYTGLDFDLIKKNLDFWTVKIIDQSSMSSNKSLHNEFGDTLSTCKSKQIKTISPSADTNTIEKASYLKKLFLLTKQGIQLTNSYNMDSDLDEIIWEYNLHTNPDKLTVDSVYVKPLCFDNYGTLVAKINDGNTKKKNININNYDIKKLLNNSNLSSLLKTIKQNNNQINKQNNNQIDKLHTNKSNESSNDASSQSDTNSTYETSSQSYTSTE